MTRSLKWVCRISRVLCVCWQNLTFIIMFLLVYNDLKEPNTGLYQRVRRGLWSAASLIPLNSKPAGSGSRNKLWARYYLHRHFLSRYVELVSWMMPWEQRGWRQWSQTMIWNSLASWSGERSERDLGHIIIWFIMIKICSVSAPRVFTYAHRLRSHPCWLVWADTLNSWHDENRVKDRTNILRTGLSKATAVECPMPKVHVNKQLNPDGTSAGPSPAVPLIVFMWILSWWP